MDVQTVSTINQGHHAPQTEIPYQNLLRADALAALSLTDLIATRDALYEGWNWQDAAIPLLEPIWQAMVETIENQILARPITSMAEMCAVIIAFSNPTRPWEHGLLMLRPHAEAFLSTLGKINVQA